MQNQEYNQFAQMWASAHEISANGKVLSNESMFAVFKALSDQPLEKISQALTKHSRTNRFAPTVADVLEIINGKTGHVSPDEAWALASKGFNPENTVILTSQILEAKGSVEELYYEQGAIPARKAFIDAYERIMKSCESMPVWFVSQGNDKQAKVGAVQDAIRLGRLPEGSDKQFLLEAQQPTGVIAGLLSGKVTELPNNPEVFKSKWRELRIAALDSKDTIEQKREESKKIEAEKRQKFEENRMEALIAIENAQKTNVEATRTLFN